MNPTNDPSLRSFLTIPEDSPFPIQNLPFGVFQRRDGTAPRIGVAIGDQVLDLSVLEEQGLLDSPALPWSVFRQTRLNAFLALGPTACHEARVLISRLLRHAEAILRDSAELRRR